ncbi:hypothetical protein THIOKS11890008 [Thiocapsa sp. KS1]|nr:hypothetical protein THIOKS11890008 [Thiocapsa sp. KS1]
MRPHRSVGGRASTAVVEGRREPAAASSGGDIVGVGPGFGRFRDERGGSRRALRAVLAPASAARRSRRLLA